MTDNSATSQYGDVAGANSYFSKQQTDNSQVHISTTDHEAVTAGTQLGSAALTANMQATANAVGLGSQALGLGGEAIKANNGALNSSLGFAGQVVKGAFDVVGTTAGTAMGVTERVTDNALAATLQATGTALDAQRTATSQVISSTNSALGLASSVIDYGRQSQNEVIKAITASAASSVGQVADAYKAAGQQANEKGIADYRILVMGALAIAAIFVAGKVLK